MGMHIYISLSPSQNEVLMEVTEREYREDTEREFREDTERMQRELESPLRALNFFEDGFIMGSQGPEELHGKS